MQTNVVSFDKIVYPFHICHFIGPAGRLSLSSWLGDPPTPPLYPRCAPTILGRGICISTLRPSGCQQGINRLYLLPSVPARAQCFSTTATHRSGLPVVGLGVGGWGAPLEAKWHGGVWFPRWKRASVDVSGNALNQRGSVKKVQVRKPRSSAIGRKQAGADEVDRSAPRGTRDTPPPRLPSRAECS